jgi:hypothetical protein
VVASWAVFRLSHGGRQCWGGPKNRRESPNTRVRSNVWKLRRGDKESPKDCTRLKRCEYLYTCPHTPFHRETKGLLHSENTLESRAYS